MPRTHRRIIASIVLAAAVVPLVSACSSATTGEGLVDSKCTTCHTLDNITAATYTTEEEWTSVVGRMEAKGLEVTDEERPLIIEYLVSQSTAQ